MTAGSGTGNERVRRRPTPMCPIRPGDPCSLCQPGANGPQDCGLVYLVMDDPELQDLVVEQRRRAASSRRQGDR